MAFVNVFKDFPVPIRRPKGSNITFVNQNAGGGTDIFLSTDRAQLSSSAPGTTPAGLKIAAGGISLQWPNYPGTIWARAIADTPGLEVLP